MRRDDLYAFFADFCKQAERLSRKKNSDYASEADPFENFKHCGEVGFVTRMSDKMTRLKNLVFREFAGKTGPEVDETIEDTLLDLFNYCWLLAGFRENEGKGPAVPPMYYSASELNEVESGSSLDPPGKIPDKLCAVCSSLFCVYCRACHNCEDGDNGTTGPPF